MKRIFSAVQPTGTGIHLGNYFGAVRQFVDLQEQSANSTDLLFCVADMHAITVKHDPKTLADDTLNIVATYKACGLSGKTLIFAQSHVPAHAEMMWILSSVARMGWMERMVQFKDKTGDNKERASIGLFTYPILMAADILLYKATHVPVGDDQKQHLNLACDIATKFNHDYGTDFFPIPKAIHSTGSRIMSLQDASKKMSKSDPDPRSRIDFSDSDDTIRNKIRRATADILPFPSSDEEVVKPEINNLIAIYSEATGEPREAVFKAFGGQGYGTFKPALADALIALVGPIRDEAKRLLTDKQDLIIYLESASDIVKSMAHDTLKQTKDLVGFLREWR